MTSLLKRIDRVVVSRNVDSFLSASTRLAESASTLRPELHAVLDQHAQLERLITENAERLEDWELSNDEGENRLAEEAYEGYQRVRAGIADALVELLTRDV